MTRRYRKNGLRCTACGKKFRADRPFTRHRIDRRTDQARCLTKAELLDRGWSYSFKAGGWTDQPRQQRIRLDTAGVA